MGLANQQLHTWTRVKTPRYQTTVERDPVEAPTPWRKRRSFGPSEVRETGVHLYECHDADRDEDATNPGCSGSESSSDTDEEAGCSRRDLRTMDRDRQNDGTDAKKVQPQSLGRLRCPRRR